MCVYVYAVGILYHAVALLAVVMGSIYFFYCLFVCLLTLSYSGLLGFNAALAMPALSCVFVVLSARSVAVASCASVGTVFLFFSLRYMFLLVVIIFDFALLYSVYFFCFEY